MIGPFFIIWLSNEGSGDNEDIFHLRTRIGSECLQIYNNRDECIDYVTDIQEALVKIYLIISLSLLDEAMEILINTFELVSSIDSMYILCSGRSCAERFPKKSTKIRGIYPDYQSLINQLLPIISTQRYRYRRFADDDFSLAATIPLPIIAITAFEFSSVNNEASASTKKQEAEFMYSQLARDILISTESKKIDMLEFCRRQYTDNEAQLRLIKEFEDAYVPRKAIFWYTRDSFLYRLLNKALREQDIDTLYSLRYFIRHLHLQLLDFHLKQTSSSRTSQNEEVITVYRGQMIKNEEFERKIQHNVGGFLSANNFLSTTTVKRLAVMFAGDGSAVDAQSILFKIDINQSVKKFPYAHVSSESVFGDDEGEVLFTMGSIFRICSIQSIGTNRWYVNLKLTGEEDKELMNLLEYMKGGLGQFTPEIHLARLLFVMAQYNKALKFLTAVMQDSQLMEDFLIRVYIYNELGDIYDKIQERDKSEEYYRKVLEIDISHLPRNHPILMANYSIRAKIHEKEGDLEQTLSYHKKMLEISLAYPDDAVWGDVHIDYRNIATIYKKQKRYSEAMDMCQKALEIQLKTLPHNHPSFCGTYQLISELFSIHNNYKEANQFSQKALDIQKNSLPRNHPEFIETYSALSSSYCKLDKYREALECVKKANELRLEYLPVMKYLNAGDSAKVFQRRIEETNELLEILQQREDKKVS